jgi:hypothetical protein
MCPERRLIDGISRVSGTNPKEYHDSVDASEANESTQCENAVQREFILPGTMEIPNHRDWQGEDDKVHEDVEGLVDDEEEVCVEALAVDAMVPVCAEWAALACAGEEDGRSPEAD